MKEIPLTHGKIAQVSEEDYADLMHYRWTTRIAQNGSFYAIRREPGTKRQIYMHRQIMNFPSGFDIDHADRDTLNNQRSNLRLATKSQNNANRPSPGGSSKYKGVHWYKPYQNWRVGIKVRGRKISLGYFTNEVDAARAYDAAAREHFGEFAFVNFQEPA